MAICSADELRQFICWAAERRHKVVMTNGCFDILHPGHIAYLTAAKALGNYLAVAINDDHSVCRLKGSSRPINPLADRMAMLDALRSVDWVLSFPQDTPQELYQHLRPHVLVKGGDYRIADIPGAQDVQAHGGAVEVLPYVAGYSTSQFLQRVQGLV